MTEPFAYSNVSDRERGPLLRIAGRVVRGIAQVHEQSRPYAEAWRRDNLAALASSGPLWVALGDSLTQGVGAPSHNAGWVNLVQARLATAGRRYRLVNLAVSGARTDEVLDRQLPALEALPAPDLVTLMIGSNDLMSPRHRKTLSDTVAAVLDRLPAGSWVATLPNPSRVAAAANRVLAERAAAGHVRVIEMRDPRLRSWRGRLAADHFHPNGAGYAAMADVVADALLGPAPGSGGG